MLRSPASQAKVREAPAPANSSTSPGNTGFSLLDWLPQRRHWIDPRRPLRRNVTRRQRRQNEQNADRYKRRRIGGTDLDQQALDPPRQRERAADAERHTAERQAEAFAQQEPQNVASLRSQGAANANFTRLMSDRIRDDTVDP